MHIGVFDSGKGGHIVADKIRTYFPDAKITVIDDHANVPYGSKNADEIYQLTKLALRPLIAANCTVIVIACNTATAVAITRLRADYPDQSFIGFEPMIKPAIKATKTKVITIFATPATLQSKRYKMLKQLWSSGVVIHEPDCTQWAMRIESGEPPYDDVLEAIRTAVESKSDVLVLACTHYLALEDFIRQNAPPNVKVIEPTMAVIERIQTSVHNADVAIDEQEQVDAIDSL